MLLSFHSPREDKLTGLTFVEALVVPVVLSVPVDFVVVPASFEVAAISPVIPPLSLLLSFVIVPDVLRIIRPSFRTFSMLEVILPLSLVHCPIGLLVHSVAIGLVILPLAFVDVTVDVIELALAACLVVLPLALVLGPVGPHLDSEAVPFLLFPLPFVNRTTFESFNRLRDY